MYRGKNHHRRKDMKFSMHRAKISKRTENREKIFFYAILCDIKKNAEKKDLLYPCPCIYTGTRKKSIWQMEFREKSEVLIL